MYTSTYYVYKYFNTNVLHICAPLSTFGHFKESGEQLRIEATPSSHQLINMECLSNEFGNEFISICNTVYVLGKSLLRIRT